MPAPKSSPGRSRAAGGSRSPAKSRRRPAKSDGGGGVSARGAAGVSDGDAAGVSDDGGGVSDGLASLAEQVTNRVLKPLGLVVLTTEKIQEVLDDAAERGRVTRSDANELAGQLISRGRQQSDQILSDIERLISRGRQQSLPATVGSRWSESIDLLARGADRARRTVGVGQTFPILAYDDLTAAQVQVRLDGLSRAELRKVREYERRHANRKSVLAAIDKSLGPQ